MAMRGPADLPSREQPLLAVPVVITPASAPPVTPESGVGGWTTHFPVLTSQ
jgi:hypothetical protein